MKNSLVKYLDGEDHTLGEDALAEEVHIHLRAIYDLVKEEHPEYQALMMIVGNKNRHTAASAVRVISQKDFKKMLKK